jgi:phosphoglycolate phosphatase
VTTVLFWDIDGTLLTTARAGVFALEEAARAVLGHDVDFAALKTAGLTDWQVAELALSTAGGDSSEANVRRFLSVYEEHLPARLHLKTGQVLDGVEPILEDLADRNDVLSLLLTGNTEAGARTKLGHYGLDRWFEAGAFCADGGDRASIARRAWELAREQLGSDPDPSASYVIGDTVHDVECGKAIGVRTIAVATGPNGGSGLAESEPWLLLDVLPAPAEFRRVIGVD